MTPLLVAITTAALSIAGSSLAAPALQPKPAPTAAPSASVSAEIIVLHGTNAGTGIDPKIGNIPALSKPPFSSYNSYKLLDRSSRALQKGKSATFKLPTSRDLQVLFKDLVPPSKQGEPTRYVISASIQKANGQAYLPNVEVSAKQGEWFFVGGQSYNGGSLVIGIKVNP